MISFVCYPDSVVNETCRLASGVFMIRYVNEDTHFQTSDGKVHLMRKNDRVAIYPPAIHKDPEIFKDPLVGVERFAERYCQKKLRRNKGPILFYRQSKNKLYQFLVNLNWRLIYVRTYVRAGFPYTNEVSRSPSQALEVRGWRCLVVIRERNV